MKRNQIIIGVVFSVFLIVSTPVLANIFHKENHLLSNNVNGKNTIDQKELLFQTILDIVKNKEIQQIILNYGIKRGGFFNLDTRFLVFTPHVLTKTELNTAYHIGLILSKNFDVSRISSMFERYRGSNQVLQKEITAVIEKDATIKGELTQLSNSKCNCEDISGVTTWAFPVICLIADTMALIGLFLALTLGCGDILIGIAGILIEIFNCPGWS